MRVLLEQAAIIIGGALLVIRAFWLKAVLSMISCSQEGDVVVLVNKHYGKALVPQEHLLDILLLIVSLTVASGVRSHQSLVDLVLVHGLDILQLKDGANIAQHCRLDLVLVLCPC